MLNRAVQGEGNIPVKAIAQYVRFVVQDGSKTAIVTFTTASETVSFVW